MTRHLLLFLLLFSLQYFAIGQGKKVIPVFNPTGTYKLDSKTYTRHGEVYGYTGDDTSCRITFHFTSKGVTVDQAQANPNFGCGFGHAVFADGYYKKVSGRVPVIKDEN
jgi:hypothetical protein